MFSFVRNDESISFKGSQELFRVAQNTIATKKIVPVEDANNFRDL